MDLDKLSADLEKEELESTNGIASADVYSKLLAIYLCQNDLCSAKYLWKRIPQSIILANPEIGAIWSIGQRLWKKDIAGSYKVINSHNWSENMSDIIKNLENKIRDSAFQLISFAYNSVSIDTVSAMTGLTKDQVIEVCELKKWNIIDNGTIIPARPEENANIVTSSEEQLYKLTDFVSFLEN